ncbi:MAG: chemotaxis protein CheW [Deltaproteobacteria bacterium]|nr:chemotaxis protein CheW [Deltaproteobacteria bacterium]
MEIVAFSVDGRLYGLDAQHVNRVIENIKIFSAPFMPKCHMGLLFYRGELYDVIDVGLLFNQKISVKDSHSRIILMKWDRNKLAIIPDVVTGLVWIDDKAIHRGASTSHGQTIDLITPESLWSRLLKLNYGPGKIS